MKNWLAYMGTEYGVMIGRIIDELAVQKRIQENFIRVQNDVREIIRKECEVSQEITPHSSIKQTDIEKLDSFE